MGLRLVNGREQEFLDRWDQYIRDLGADAPNYITQQMNFHDNCLRSHMRKKINDKLDEASGDKSEWRSIKYMRKQMERRIDMQNRAGRKHENEEADHAANIRKPIKVAPAGGATERVEGSDADEETLDPPDPAAAVRPRKEKGDKRSEGKGDKSDKKNKPCFEFCRGRCKLSEEKCEYSHSRKICDPWKKANLRNPGSAGGDVSLYKSKGGHVPVRTAKVCPKGDKCKDNNCKLSHKPSRDI